MKIISYNVLGIPRLKRPELRIAQISRALAAEQPDIVAFQEFHATWLLRSAGEIRTQLPHLYAAKGPIGPTCGLVILSRTPFDSIRAIRFSKIFSGKGHAHKGMLVVERKDLVVVNTHFSWTPTPTRSSKPRAEQLSYLQEYVSSVSKPLVVCGDFNIAHGSDLYRQFIGNTGLIDGSNGETTFGRGRLRYRIDHALVRGMKVTESSVLFQDHTAHATALGHAWSDHSAVAIETA